jgi:quercetin dioxygenase-like cupin family protein
MRRTSTCTERPQLFRHAGRDLRILIDGERTDGTYTVVEVRTTPEAGPPPHVHSAEDEHLHVLEGELTVTLDGAEHTLGPGDELTLPRDIPHHVRAASADARYLTVCTPSGLETFLRATREDEDGAEISSDDFSAHLAGAGLRYLRPAAATRA